MFDSANSFSMEGRMTKVQGTDLSTRSHSASSVAEALASNRSTILNRSASVISFGEMRRRPPRGMWAALSKVTATTSGGSRRTPGFKPDPNSVTRLLDIGTSGVQETNKSTHIKLMPQVYCTVVSPRMDASSSAASKAALENGSTKPMRRSCSGRQLESGIGSDAANRGHCILNMCKAFATSTR